MLTFGDLIYPEIGKRLLALRKGKFTQEQLAEELEKRGLSLKRASIANIEKGKQRIMLHALYEIAEVMGVEVCELLPSIKEVRGNSSKQKGDSAEIAWAKGLTRQVTTEGEK